MPAGLLEAAQELCCLAITPEHRATALRGFAQATCSARRLFRPPDRAPALIHFAVSPNIQKLVVACVNEGRYHRSPRSLMGRPLPAQSRAYCRSQATPRARSFRELDARTARAQYLDLAEAFQPAPGERLPGRSAMHRRRLRLQSPSTASAVTNSARLKG